MDTPTLYRLAADAVLFVHAMFVAFVVLGLGLVFVGGWRGWPWVRNRAFRILHLAAIGVVVLQAWAGVLCPLTTWESMLRARAGEATYPGSFIAYWVGELLYFRAPAWVFVVTYSAFGLLVVYSWLHVRPAAARRR